MRVAIVHDWLTGMRGGEKVLECFCELFPGAPVYTLIHIRGSVSETIEKHRIHTSFLQRAPFIKKHYRRYLPFFPTAIEKLNLRGFDTIISSSHCVAKGIIPSPSAYHFCYCHTPMRYIWSHYDDYFGNHRTGKLMRTVLPFVRDYLCSWDVEVNARVDHFAVNSAAVAERVRKYYGRESTVIYPPVDVEYFTPSEEDSRGGFFLIVSALVPYKRIELAIEAFNSLPHRLVIVGTGPDYDRLKKIAGQNVEFLGNLDTSELRSLYRTAAGLIQPGEEDFGINMVEALACHCPVIAYGRGGALEIVTEGETGLFFYDLTPQALAKLVDKTGSLSFNKALMRKSAVRFSPARFKDEIQKILRSRLADADHGLQKK